MEDPCSGLWVLSHVQVAETFPSKAAADWGTVPRAASTALCTHAGTLTSAAGTAAWHGAQEQNPTGCCLLSYTLRRRCHTHAVCRARACLLAEAQQFGLSGSALAPQRLDNGKQLALQQRVLGRQAAAHGAVLVLVHDGLLGPAFIRSHCQG